MFCTRCGVSLEGNPNFCSQCGHQIGARASNPYPKLSRPRDDRKIAGVCAGFARYLGVDVTLIRLIAIVLAIWPIGLGLIAYIVAWIVMPNDALQLAAPVQEPAGHTA